MQMIFLCTFGGILESRWLILKIVKGNAVAKDKDGQGFCIIQKITV